MPACANCHKLLPSGDRFCAYCGTRQPWRLPWFGGTGATASWLPGRTVPRQLVTAGLGGALGAASGALLGAILSNPWLGGFMGALGAGVVAAVGETVAGPIPDQRAAQRFGVVVGASGGVLALPIGFVVLLIVVVAAQGLIDGLTFLRLLMQAQFTYGLLGGLVSTAAGVLGGGALGYYCGQGGYRFGRRGALLGAALAFTLASGVAGGIIGGYASTISGAELADTVALGVLLQVCLGVLLLTAARPALARLRWWWVRRP